MWELSVCRTHYLRSGQVLGLLGRESCAVHVFLFYPWFGLDSMVSAWTLKEHAEVPCAHDGVLLGLLRLKLKGTTPTPRSLLAV